MYVMHEKMFRASLEAGNMPPVGLVQTTLSMRDFDCTLSVCHNDDCVKSNHPEESKVLSHAAYPTMRPIPSDFSKHRDYLK